uniref:Uncharacterized protein n=1 Tax=Arundo donax TaxID=35708 RepID=A0A0A9EAD9_ARUDO
MNNVTTLLLFVHCIYNTFGVFRFIFMVDSNSWWLVKQKMSRMNRRI